MNATDDIWLCFFLRRDTAKRCVELLLDLYSLPWGVRACPYYVPILLIKTRIIVAIFIGTSSRRPFYTGVVMLKSCQLGVCRENRNPNSLGCRFLSTFSSWSWSRTDVCMLISIPCMHTYIHTYVYIYLFLHILIHLCIRNALSSVSVWHRSVANILMYVFVHAWKHMYVQTYMHHGSGLSGFRKHSVTVGAPYLTGLIESLAMGGSPEIRLSAKGFS